MRKVMFALLIIVTLISSCAKRHAELLPQDTPSVTTTPVSTDTPSLQALPEYNASQKRGSELKEMFVNTQCEIIIADLYGFSSDGAEITGYFNGETYIAIMANIFGESGKGFEWIYLGEDYIYYIRTLFEYNLPYYATDSVTIVDSETHKYIVFNDTMYELNYIGENVIALSNDEFEYEMRFITACIEALEEMRNAKE